MKVLLANKFFYDHGGPETVLFATRDLLLAGGHDVIDFAMMPAERGETGLAATLATAFRRLPVTSRRTSSCGTSGQASRQCGARYGFSTRERRPVKCAS